MRNTILVTGGAGYIGSHVVKQLGKLYDNIIVLDNLSTGFKDAVTYGKLVIGDTGDSTLVTDLIKEHGINTVMHFAAHTIVPESVSNPLKYYLNNTCKTRNLLQSCAEQGVEHFIFSSTAAVYGIPQEAKASEETPLAPINPYGTSKLMSEYMLRDLAIANKMRYVILRYFNVAGSDLECQIGQSTLKATLLVKVACEAAAGLRDKVTIFGTDYPTSDGTGIRDYIHVEDLADAHIKSLQYLQNGGESATLNCGYGHGFSVREVLQAVEKVSQVKLKIVEDERRPGDPPILIASAERIKKLINWSPNYDNLETIVASSLAWEKNKRY